MLLDDALRITNLTRKWKLNVSIVHANLKKNNKNSAISVPAPTMTGIINQYKI